MKPAPFRYHDPASIAEALDVLARCDNARALAGGQSLVPMLNFRFVQPDDIVDLNRIRELESFDIGADQIRIGAMTRQRALEKHDALASACPIVRAALAHVGHRQTRNRGTIGGSLCHLDPSAELVNLACLHDARLTVRSARGERVLDFTQFAQGYLTTDLAPDELLVAIEIVRWPRGHGWAFEEVARRQGDFAIAAASALIELDTSNALASAAICVSGVGSVPIRLVEAEAMLAGTQGSDDLYRAAAETVASIEAIDDAYVGARYRSHVGRVLVFRALQQASARAKASRPQHG